MLPYNDKTAVKLLKNARKISFHGGKEYFPSTDRRSPVSENPFSKSLDTRINSCLLRRQWSLHRTTMVIAKPCVYLLVALHLFEKYSFHPLASIGVQESWSSHIPGWLFLWVFPFFKFKIIVWAEFKIKKFTLIIIIIKRDVRLSDLRI